ncbi:MAG: hypothetical protein UDM07_07135, partial [Adlercreutzia sp.]|nr:hypothetical protein [Adlercreutzia sp.]
RESDLKQTIVGHWGTCPGQNFIYTHLDRVIKRDDLDMIYLSGPGHGGNAMVAQDWLDGSYTEVYPNITRDKDGMQRLFKRFSFPGGIPSHVAPETPGSIHEGGELGYSLAHAFGAVADNPDLIAACVVGDGEAETGPLATSWHGNKFMNPITDGAVLPILHLNGFKIANPTIFSRMSHEEIECFFRGCGWEPRCVEGSEPELMHQQMAAALDWAIREIHRIQRTARKSGKASRPHWPMLVLRTPKGWTGPRKSTVCRSKAAGAPIRCPFPWVRRKRRICRCSRAGCARTSPKSSSIRTARRWSWSRPSRPQARAAWVRTRTRTAVSCCATCARRTSAITRSIFPLPVRQRHRICTSSAPMSAM